MKALFLNIFDALSKRKRLSAVIVLALLALCIALATRMRYVEDISEFLPSDPASERYSATSSAAAP